MPTIEINVDPGNSKELFDPRNENIRHFETVIPFYEAIKLKRGNANVRPPEPKKAPFIAMLDTVEKEPDLFHIKNRGITYICDKASFSDGKLTVSLPDIHELKAKGARIPRFGIADGGHTFEVINRVVTNEKDYEAIAGWQMPCVRVHFLVTPDNTKVESFVEALNTSTQVKQHTLDEYQNKFAPLKKALTKGGFDLDLVGFTENAGREWDVREIIQRLACFLPQRWETVEPVQMYKSQNKALKLFRTPDGLDEFREIFPIVVDLMTLPEFIQSEFSKGEFLKDRKLGKQVWVKNLKQPWTRPGTTYATSHKFDKAILMPIAAAFRKLLVMRGSDTYEWVVDPKEAFRSCADKMYKTMLNRVNKAGGYVAHVGSDSETWSACSMVMIGAKDNLLTAGPIVRKRKRDEEDDDMEIEVSDDE